LLPAGSEVLIHVTGSYAKQDFSNIPAAHLRPVSSPDDIQRVIVEPSAIPHVQKVRQAV
jgi:hypothetical protein